MFACVVEKIDTHAITETKQAMLHSLTQAPSRKIIIINEA
jgi:hypothetical protein